MIHVLRHCEALHNISGIYDYDTNLTSNGVLHAQSLCGDYDYIICSPLKRCIQTYKHSKINCIDGETNNNAREQILNICDMMTDIEIPETFNDMMNRIYDLKEYLANKKFNNKKILIVTHKHVISALSNNNIANADNGEFHDITHYVIT